ncbi:hypothetical protein EVAR_60563_1 [Eumeta japonica]|uniref:Uncharacterized protein n=1 Tax=Eumeta variegata TaxID=151549 RepID=A0A4C1YGH1_EUMVA|nr:hypothetical protein EVAR_60563_1 [Eumeta japonica]
MRTALPKVPCGSLDSVASTCDAPGTMSRAPGRRDAQFGKPWSNPATWTVDVRHGSSLAEVELPVIRRNGSPRFFVAPLYGHILSKSDRTTRRHTGAQRVEGYRRLLSSMFGTDDRCKCSGGPPTARSELRRDELQVDGCAVPAGVSYPWTAAPALTFTESSLFEEHYTVGSDLSDFCGRCVAVTWAPLKLKLNKGDRNRKRSEVEFHLSTATSAMTTLGNFGRTKREHDLE